MYLSIINKKNIQDIGMFFLFLLVTNLVFWFFSFYTGSIRPLINIDYFLIIIFFIVKNKFFNLIGIIFLFFVLSLDILLWIRQFFPFLTPIDAAILVKFFFSGPSVYKLGILFFIFYFLFFIFFYHKISKNFFSRRLIVFLIGFCVFNLISNYYKVEKNLSIYVNDGFFVSQIYYVYNLKNHMTFQQLSWKPILSKSDYISVLSNQFTHVKNKNFSVLFVINESWGEVKNKEIEKDLLHNISNTKQFQQGSIDFSGATVNAEMRELCQLKTSNFNMKSIESGLQDCYPNKLKNEGFETYAIHGANSTVYDRYKWYSQVGFDHTLFFENLNNPTRCYSFAGACDKDIVTMVPNLFNQNNNKKFIYWLTLNTHYPYDNRDLKKYIFDCEKFSIKKESEVCRNLNLQKQFFNNLSKIINNKALKNTWVIVVGDHEPPLITKVDTKIFIKNKVSWLKFYID
jgi:phosphoglycerol transferase MdoB-like AlkP superfamily enzyme